MHLRTRIVLFLVVVVTLVMTLVPPWYVRERQWASEPFGPERAVGYAMINHPPHQSNGKIITAVARIDLTRLILQYVAALLVATGTILVLGWKRSNTGGLTFTHSASDGDSVQRKQAIMIKDQQPAKAATIPVPESIANGRVRA